MKNIKTIDIILLICTGLYNFMLLIMIYVYNNLYTYFCEIFFNNQNIYIYHLWYDFYEKPLNYTWTWRFHFHNEILLYGQRFAFYLNSVLFIVLFGIWKWQGTHIMSLNDVVVILIWGAHDVHNNNEMVNILLVFNRIIFMISCGNHRILNKWWGFSHWDFP